MSEYTQTSTGIIDFNTPEREYNREEMLKALRETPGPIPVPEKINVEEGVENLIKLAAEKVAKNEGDHRFKFELEYPTLAAEFRKVQQEQYETFAKKMLSYGLGNIAVGTSLETKEEKDLSITSVWIRSMDKMQRLKQLVLLNKENPLEDEPTMDAWKDLSVYAIIAQLVTLDHWKK